MKRLRLVNEYGGKGELTFPADHVPAIRVPKGGSCHAEEAIVTGDIRRAEAHFLSMQQIARQL